MLVMQGYIVHYSFSNSVCYLMERDYKAKRKSGMSFVMRFFKYMLVSLDSVGVVKKIKISPLDLTKEIQIIQRKKTDFVHLSLICGIYAINSFFVFNK